MGHVVDQTGPQQELTKVSCVHLSQGRPGLNGLKGAKGDRGIMMPVSATATSPISRALELEYLPDPVREGPVP